MDHNNDQYNIKQIKPDQNQKVDQRKQNLDPFEQIYTQNKKLEKTNQEQQKIQQKNDQNYNQIDQNQPKTNQKQQENQNANQKQLDFSQFSQLQQATLQENKYTKQLNIGENLADEKLKSNDDVVNDKNIVRQQINQQQELKSKQKEKNNEKDQGKDHRKTKSNKKKNKSKSNKKNKEKYKKQNRSSDSSSSSSNQDSDKNRSSIVSNSLIVISDKLNYNKQDIKTNIINKEKKEFDQKFHSFNKDKDMLMQYLENIYDQEQQNINQLYQNRQQIEQQEKQNQMKKDLAEIVAKQNLKVLIQPQEWQDNQVLTIQCEKNHIWDTTVDILKQYSCPKCQQVLDIIQRQAESNKGRVVNTFLSENLIFECEKKHQFSLTQDELFKGNWCQKCCEEFFNTIKNNKLFPQTRVQPPTVQADQQIISYFLLMKNNMVEKCKQKARNYLEENKCYPQTIESLQNIESVLFIMDLQENLYKGYLNNLNQEQLKEEYIQMSKSLNPGIVNHPFYAYACIKFQNIFQSYMPRINQQQ